MGKFSCWLQLIWKVRDKSPGRQLLPLWAPGGSPALTDRSSFPPALHRPKASLVTVLVSLALFWKSSTLFYLPNKYIYPGDWYFLQRIRLVFFINTLNTSVMVKCPRISLIQFMFLQTKLWILLVDQTVLAWPKSLNNLQKHVQEIWGI